MTISRSAIVLLAVLLALGGPATSAGPGTTLGATEASAASAPLPQRWRMTMGLIPIIPSATIFVPKDKGYFEAEGIDLDWEVVQVTSEALAQVAAGNLHLAQATIGAALLNAFHSGLDVRIVAGMHGMPPSGPGGDPLIVRKALWDSGEVRDAAGLRGRKIAVNGTGVFSEYAVDEAMRTAGLTSADVDMQVVAFPDVPVALRNDVVDAAFVPEPFATQSIELGLAAQIVPEWIRGAQITLLIGGPTFLRDRPMAEAFMRAYVRGLRDLGSEGWTSPAHAAIIERYTRVPAATVQKILPQYADPEARVNWDSLMTQQRFYLDRGYLRSTELLDLVRWGEDGPRQAALLALGP